MVTGLELIPLFIDIAPVAFKLIMKLMPNKGRSDSETKLNSVNSIIAKMKPLIDGMKQVEGARTTIRGPNGVPDELKLLMQTVEEGNQLVRKRKGSKELEEWTDSFRASLSIAMFTVLRRMAVNVEEIKQLLLPYKSPQIHFHLYFKEAKYQTVYEEFIHSVNMLKGPESPLQGVKSSSAEKTKVTELSIQNFPQTSQVVAVNTPTEPDLQKVVFEVLARDDYGKKIVEKAAGNVKGVIYAERVVQDNQPTDLVIVVATKIFVKQDMIEYLKKKLNRRHVYERKVV